MIILNSFTEILQFYILHSTDILRFSEESVFGTISNFYISNGEKFYNIGPWYRINPYAAEHDEFRWHLIYSYQSGIEATLQF